MLRPQLNPTRDARSLDGLWRFCADTDGVGFEKNWAQNKLPGTAQMAVPGSVNDLFADEKIRNHVGYWFYQREVFVPATWTDTQIVLRFGSVTHHAVVFVDDVEVFRFSGGYIPFEVSVTDHVRPGENFRLTVAVDNRLSNVTIPPGEVVTLDDGRQRQDYLHDFYNYTGIHRSVYLISRPVKHLHDVSITTDYTGTTGTVSWKLDIRCGGLHDDPCTHKQLSSHVEIIDPADGQVVATASGNDGSVEIPNVRLWQPGVGGQYDFRVSLRDSEGQLADQYTEKFGVRRVEVKDSQFLINGEPFYFTGFGMHEDHETIGKAHSNAHLIQDMELLRWIGANSLRTSHYPYSEEFMDYCDEHGVVVIDETPAVGLNLGVVGGMIGGDSSDDSEQSQTFGPDKINEETQAQHAKEIQRLIARDKNRPSVVLWSIANEPESHTQASREYFAPLVEVARQADPTRPVGFVNVMTAPYDKDKITDLFDVIMLNRYYGWYFDTGDLISAEKHLREEIQGWIDTHPGKPIIFTEFGADTVAGMHSIYSQPFTEDFQWAFHEMYARVFDSFDEVVGEQMWNFADFQTKYGVARVDGNKKGTFTRDRKPKAVARFLRQRWHEHP